MGYKMSIERFNVHLGIIVDTRKPLDVISNIIGVQQTNQFRTDTGNRWVYTKIFKGQENINNCLQEFYASIPNLAGKINDLRQYGSCVFRISIVSLLGQLGFTLSEFDLQFLSQFNIPLEISILSFGKCIDDTDST